MSDTSNENKLDDDKLEEYTSDGYEYKFLHVGEIDFEDKSCIIADGKSPIKGQQIDDAIISGKEIKIKRLDAFLLENLRIKEEWGCYIKIKSDDEFYQEILDIILINTKLLNNLPEEDIFAKLDSLHWSWFSTVKIGNYNLSVFETKYFNNVDYIPTKDLKKFGYGHSVWYEYIHNQMMEDDNEIVVIPHGFVSFAGNKTYDIYGIKDSKNGEVLAIDIEIEALDNEDTSPNTSYYGNSYVTTYGNYVNTSTPVVKNRVNSANIKTL